MSCNPRRNVACSPERVFEVLAPLLEGHFGDQFTEEVVVNLLTFLHTIILTIADEALADDESSGESDEEREDEIEEGEWEDQTDESDENDEDDESFPSVSTALTEWMKDFIYRLREEVLTTHYLELMKLCGIDLRKAMRLALSHKPFESALTYQLDSKLEEKLIKLVTASYENIVLNLDIKNRPSFMALQIYEQSEGPKEIKDEEDEKKVEAYILENPKTCLELEKEEIQYLIPELLKEYGSLLQSLVADVGPQLIEGLMTRAILPKIDEHHEEQQKNFQ